MALMMGQMQAMQAMLAPSIAFHAAADNAGEDDVRFMFEVRIIKGKDTFFGMVSGTSTLPGLVADSQLHLAVEKVSNEMITKVVGPVSGKFQDLANAKALAMLEIDSPRVPSKSIAIQPPSLDVDLAVEAEIISQQSELS